MTHELKLSPKYFNDVEKGLKNFEIRKNDRDFKVGDILILKEWDKEYTGKEIRKEVKYLFNGKENSGFGLSEDYCILVLDNNKELSEELEKIKAEIKDMPNANPSHWYTADVVDREDLIDMLNEHIYEQDNPSKVQSHSEKDIYNGCISLMERLIGEFQDYLQTALDINIEELDEESLFSLSIPKEEIVQTLFLNKTSHSGGASTIKKCKELGLDLNDTEHLCFDEVLDREQREDEIDNIHKMIKNWAEECYDCGHPADPNDFNEQLEELFKDSDEFKEAMDLIYLRCAKEQSPEDYCFRYYYDCLDEIRGLEENYERE